MVKISYAMNVLNGVPFIKYQLDSIYKHAHEIIIIEGAYKKFAHASLGGRSKDETLSIIESYPDTQGKIKLITREGFYDERKDMCNEFFKYATGDVIWQVDVDEFYSDETHRYVKYLFCNDEKLDQVSFKFFDYYGGFDYIIEGYDESLLDVVRVSRIFPGMSWLSQRPPTLELGGEELIPRKKIDGSAMFLKGHVMHNATMLFDAQVQDKFEYYSVMWPAGVAGDQSWFQLSWRNFELKFCVAGMLNALTFVVPRVSVLPEALSQMESDISGGKWADYRFSSKKVSEKISEDADYVRKIRAARAINSIKTSTLKEFIPFAITAASQVMSLPQSRDKSFMCFIFLKSIKSRALNAFRLLIEYISSGLRLRK